MKTLTALLLFALATPAMAYTGNDYLQDVDDEYQWSQGFSRGFVLGITRSYEAFGTVGVCAKFPEGVTGEQRLAVFNKYLADHPEETHLPVELLVPKAFKDAFGARATDTGLCFDYEGGES